MLFDETWLQRMRMASYGLVVLLVFGVYWGAPRFLRAQEGGAGPTPTAPPVDPAAAVAEEKPKAKPASDGKLEVFDENGRINFINLIISGGEMMIPICFMSFLVVAVGIERAISLRESKVIPQELVEGLGKLSTASGGFNPREAYKLCQRYPSTAATVVQDMLLKVGRPHSEVEGAVEDASQREAERMYSYVRWLNLATAVTPLMGLLGTVWGMVLCFHGLAILAPGGESKIVVLSEGIYVALITTVGGLVVAIPSSILAHYYEGRIQSLMHQVSELLSSLMPQVEKFEGRVRFGRFSADQDEKGADSLVESSESRAKSSAAPSVKS